MLFHHLGASGSWGMRSRTLQSGGVLGFVACAPSGSGSPTALDISGGVVYPSLNKLSAQTTGVMQDYSGTRR